jgi:hypothetical protein
VNSAVPSPEIVTASRWHAERTPAHGELPRVLADEAAKQVAEQVALGLLRAAAALEQCARSCEELAADAEATAGVRLRRKADNYYEAAVRYREMATQYRGIGKHLP